MKNLFQHWTRLCLALSLAVLGAVSSSAIEIKITDPPYNAVCDTTTDITSPVANAIAYLYANGGGTLLFPGSMDPNKKCRVNSGLALNSPVYTEVPIKIKGDGGLATLTCASCSVLVRIGGLGYITYNKTLEDLRLDLSTTTSQSVAGVYLDNVIRPQLINVTIVNSVTRTNTTAIHLSNSSVGGTCSAPGVPSGTCFGAYLFMMNPDINGTFDFGVRIQGARPTQNDNNNNHMILGGRIIGNRSCGSSACYGVYAESNDTLMIQGTDIENFHTGIHLRGMNATLVGTRTENNTTGVYFPTTDVPGGPTRAYNHRIFGGNHADGSWTLCPTCSAVESYNQYGQVSVLPRQKRVMGAPTCTTGTQVGSTCDVSVPLSSDMGHTQYTAVCTAQNVTGVPMLNVLVKYNSSIIVRVAAATTTTSGTTATIDCKIDSITAF